MKIIKLLSKLNPFGSKNNLEISEESKINIERLIVQYPEIWEAIKEVATSIMNRDAKRMVTAENKDDYATRIRAMDDFVKECLTVKRKIYDNVVDMNGHLPVLPGKMGAEQLNPLPQPPETKKKINLMDYIMSKDIRDKNGRVRLTVDRPNSTEVPQQPR